MGATLVRTRLLASPDRFQTIDDIIRLSLDSPSMMNIIRLVEALNLPDCWTGVSFVRNVVRDALHDRPWSPSDSDIDVVYFDADNLDPAHANVMPCHQTQGAPLA